MLNSEEPIKLLKDDELERKHFSKNLMDAIIKYNDFYDNSLTIGLFGKWGSGKTSIIFMLKEYFKEVENKNQIIFEFNPWFYSSENNFIQLFFDELIRAIDITNPNDIDLKNKLEVYSKNISNTHSKYDYYVIKGKYNIYKIKNFFKKYLTKDFIIEQSTSVIDSHAGTDLKPEKKDEIAKLNELKNEVNSKIKKYHILCIIDDIDRLSDKGIIDIFKLVKTIADFQNITFLLAFDQEICANALNKLQKNKGKDYLEKIINVPIHVPMITIDEIRKSFKNNLTETVDKFNVKNFEENRWNNFFYKNTNIMSFFKNLRDIKRFFNIFNFNYSLINIDVNFADLLALTLIQTFKPEFYQIMIKNEKLLTSYFISDEKIFGYVKSIACDPETDPIFSENIGILYKCFKKEIDSEESEFLKDILNFLFPELLNEKNNMYTYSFIDDFDEGLNICYYGHFRSYFKLDPKYKTLTEEEIGKYIKILYNPETINFFLRELKSENMLYTLLNIIKNRLNLLNMNFESEIISSLYMIEKYIVNDRKYHVKTPIFSIVKKLIGKSQVSYQTICSYWETSTNLLFDLSLFEYITKERMNLEYNHWINNENYINLKKIITDRIENFNEECVEKYSYNNFHEMFWIFKGLNKLNITFYKDIFNNFFFNDIIIVAFLHDAFIEILRKYDNLCEVKDKEIITVMDYLIKYQDIDSISQKIENLNRNKEEYKDFIDKLIYLFERGKYLYSPHVQFMKNCFTIV